jgi:hypothetical protein
VITDSSPSAASELSASPLKPNVCSRCRDMAENKQCNQNLLTGQQYKTRGSMAD